MNPRGDKAETVSGPGWSNLLCGVWPDKHGVTNNTFKGRDYESYPHFFAHVREAYPGAKLYSFVTWTPIKKYIVSAADESDDFTTDPKKPDYAKADTLCLEQAIRTLETGDPDVLMVYQGQVDEAGHSKGFHPTVKEYVTAIETVDANVGKLLTALKARPGYAKENWLILVSTDHGGKGTNHSGRDNPEVTTIFQIVNGPAAAKGAIEGPTYQVDLVATALTHLGIAHETGVEARRQSDRIEVGIGEPIHQLSNFAHARVLAHGRFS
ncbi:MAG: alkaline phosphatase family protein [Pirellulales bacterium]